MLTLATMFVKQSLCYHVPRYKNAKNSVGRGIGTV